MTDVKLYKIYYHKQRCQVKTRSNPVENIKSVVC